jgi:hypothetical protein
VSWRHFEEELARWRGAGRVPDFWWRDDDAGPASPALARLLALARGSGVPLALAIVPANADPAVLAGLDAGVSAIQHGTDHVNRAGQGEKKTEFPAAEAATEAVARLSRSLGILRQQAPERFVPVLAPPWNRLPERLIPHLGTAGYAGISRYGARGAAEPCPRLRQVNTHVDIIAWRGDRGFVGEQAALAAAARHLAARRSGAVDGDEPTGLLTHHLCHDEGAWRFLERLFAFTRARGARWRAAGEMFL